MPLFMNAIPRWSLRARVAVLAVGAAAITATIGGFAIWTVNKTAGSLRSVYEERTVPLARLDIVGRTLERQRATVLATIAAPTDPAIKALQASMAADGREMAKALGDFGAAMVEGEEKALATQFTHALGKLQSDGLAKVLNFLNNGQNIEADAASQSRYLPQAETVSRQLNDLIALQVSLAQREYIAATQWVRWHAVATVIATVLALLFGLLFAAFIARALQRALGASEFTVMQAAQNLAQGQLTTTIAVNDGHDGSVAASLNHMAQSFGRLIADAASSARWVVDAAARLAKGSRDLSTRTQSQAATLEETAAAMATITATARQTSDDAQQARTLALDGQRVAKQGRHAMNGISATMEGITQHSRDIGGFVSVIDSIAFQTNLLALNAAVEAARAGEHGRGFAVVAAEVRNLSQRSVSAAQEIKTLIASSSARILHVVQLVAQADKTMSEIVATTQGVSNIIAGIASGSTDQMAGIAQINTAMAQLEHVTQQNSGLADHASADAEAMTEQAQSLVTAVSRFCIHVPAAPAAPLDRSAGLKSAIKTPNLTLIRNPRVFRSQAPRAARDDQGDGQRA